MKIRTLAGALTLCVLFAQFSLADDCCCPVVCKLVKTTKKITIVKYDCKCETICLPCPSQRCRKDCVANGKKCGCCNEFVSRFTWTPGGATPYSRKKLVKYLVTKEVPTYQWEMVKECSCGASEKSAGLPPMPPPVDYGKLKYGAAPTAPVRFDVIVRDEPSEEKAKTSPKPQTNWIKLSLKTLSWPTNKTRR